jgi:SAM-dependent methyltransferase
MDARDWPERLEYDSTRKDHTQREHVERYKWAAERVSGQVLDAACGSGYGSALLSANAKVTAVDRDPAAVAQTLAAAPRATAVQVDLPLLPFADASFDFVVSFETVEHVPDDRALLREFRRVLKPSGGLLISTPNGALTADAAADDLNPWHEREYRLEEVSSLLADTGFTSSQMFCQRLLIPTDRNPRRTIKRLVSRFPIFCRPGRWWDTIAHGSPFVQPWEGAEGVPFFWIASARTSGVR